MYLAIETSSLVSSVAVGTSDLLRGEMTIQATLTHSEQLVPHIDQLLRMTQLTPSNLKGVVVSIGPGSFTGLRIGLGTAKAMAYGLQIPIIGIMTMEAMAYNLMYAQERIAVCIDAQKDNIYEAIYQWKGGRLQCLQEPTIRHIEEALALLKGDGQRTLFIGDGIYLEEELIAAYSNKFTVCSNPYAIPRAQSLLLAARERLEKESYDDPMTLLPFYMRRSEAEVLWEKRHNKMKDISEGV